MTGCILSDWSPTEVTTRYLVGVVARVKDGPDTLRLLLLSFVLEHFAVHSYVVALDRQGRLRSLCVDNEVVVAVGAELVGLLELLDVLSEALLALLAGKDHLEALFERVVLLFHVTLDAVKPFSTYMHDQLRALKELTLEAVKVDFDLASTYSTAIERRLGR
ncbi:hypothetical protein HG530_003293 [Fusarium avenaceum]|nr:hypothetical protein HG530_003293 [Fusarium avenaceum]